NKFNSDNVKFSDFVKGMAKKQQLASLVYECLGVLMVTFIVLFVGNLVLNGDSVLSAAQFIGYIGIFSQFTRPAKALSDSFTNINVGLAAGERVLELIDKKPEIKDAPDAITVSNFKDSIVLDDISFSYGEKKILDHVSVK